LTGRVQFDAGDYANYQHEVIAGAMAT
jgi:hypothetical protein